MNEDGIGCLMYTIIAIIVIIVCVVITKAIVNSDLPLWLKIMLLR